MDDIQSFTDALWLVSYMEEEGFQPSIEYTKENNSTYWRLVIDNIPENAFATYIGLLRSIGINPTGNTMVSELEIF
jgi:hypothetical protein